MGLDAPCLDVLALYDDVEDHRDPRGRWHPLAFLLAVLTCAFVNPTYATITGAADWAAAATQHLLATLGGRRDPFTGLIRPPSESTLDRLVTHLPAQRLEEVSRALTARLLITTTAGIHDLLAGAGIRAAACDGKVVHGSRRRATVTGAPARAATYLVSVVTHATTTCAPMVIAQTEADLSAHETAANSSGTSTSTSTSTSTARSVQASKKGEAAAARVMLSEVDLTGTVVTFDAAHVYPDTARVVAKAGGHYVIALKANQPTLMAAADAHVAAARSAATLDVAESHDRGHGRLERRVVEVVHVTDPDTVEGADACVALPKLAFPQVTAVIRVTRWYKATTEKVWEAKETTLLVTSLPRHLATAQVAAVLTRGHWSVEVTHWVRDVGFGEDATTVHTGHGPVNVATVRNIILTMIAAVAGKVAATRRQASATHQRCVDLLTGRLKPDKTRS